MKCFSVPHGSHIYVYSVLSKSFFLATRKFRLLSCSERFADPSSAKPRHTVGGVSASLSLRSTQPFQIKIFHVSLGLMPPDRNDKSTPSPPSPVRPGLAFLLPIEQPFACAQIRGGPDRLRVGKPPDLPRRSRLQRSSKHGTGVSQSTRLNLLGVSS
ncbi:hypothetical protein BDW74DRAFT_103206 [Aspergillus multicolor]|uniref:uncharacterized protein n=1 Tax=Aspergillus multicolor TaxID=41759 RepID=UPI003CCCDFDC